MSERMSENERFGTLLFNEKAMKRYIPGESLDVWRECVRTRTVLPEKIAADIAERIRMAQIKAIVAVGEEQI